MSRLIDNDGVSPASIVLERSGDQQFRRCMRDRIVAIVCGGRKRVFQQTGNECYCPELVGQKREIVIGKKAGVVSVEAKLNELGVSFPREELPRLVETMKATAMKTKRPVGTDAFKKLVESLAERG